ncbi:hypothetical protein AWB76_03278 [Caballeronia temeraria]|uniref:Uncharacterized protein n=1 Tax=Caballeronia temeraria TaxID=1777137 RepID=A0A158AY19_9BURK|nr:hypothetical protein [Caballeronia temeraria]SAK62609.1 hypothetical protein AWB76_03278 [Caballeronia temeraria]
MKRPTDRQRAAIDSLQRNGDAYRSFLEWLHEVRVDVLAECARMDDDIQIRRLQGEARCLADLISTLKPKD